MNLVSAIGDTDVQMAVAADLREGDQGDQRDHVAIVGMALLDLSVESLTAVILPLV